jgi:GTP-sensing pleiotropic transcriptional regulator CodY
VVGGINISILDGQHRVGALEILLAKNKLSSDDRILVEVFAEVDDERAKDLFLGEVLTVCS